MAEEKEYIDNLVLNGNRKYFKADGFTQGGEIDYALKDNAKSAANAVSDEASARQEADKALQDAIDGKMALQKSVGSSTTPIYLNSNGKAVACNPSGMEVKFAERSFKKISTSGTYLKIFDFVKGDDKCIILFNVAVRSDSVSFFGTYRITGSWNANKKVIDSVGCVFAGIDTNAGDYITVNANDKTGEHSVYINKKLTNAEVSVSFVAEAGVNSIDFTFRKNNAIPTANEYAGDDGLSFQSGYNKLNVYARCDYNGNIITDTYATKTALSTELAKKQDTITGAASTMTDQNLTANRVMITDGNGKAAVSSTTQTELGRLAGVTDNVQKQLNERATATNLQTEATVRKDADDALGKRIDELNNEGGDTTTKNYIYGMVQRAGLVSYLYSSWVGTVNDDTVAEKPATAKAMVEYIKGKVSGAFKFKTTLTVEQASALVIATQEEGWVYNISDSGEIAYEFEGEQRVIEVKAGDNIVWTADGWDSLVGIVDLSAYATVAALNEAINTITQYINSQDQALEGSIGALDDRIKAVEGVKHSHGNKSVLDGTQESFTTILKNKLDGICEGANKVTASFEGTTLNISIT